uniref:10 kDa chaperonin n=1 Tax=Dictyoglomus turgidum TaxID=513050 RepID=A0A7C3WM70_9BACT
MIKPMGTKILVRILEEERVTSGGIIMPDDAHQDAIGYGIVEAVGPGYWRDGRYLSIEEVDGLKVGMKVSFIKFLKDTHTNEGIRNRIGDDLILIDTKDILTMEET